MPGCGFQAYHGVGDLIGWSQGGYLYDAVTTGQKRQWKAASMTGHGREPCPAATP